MSRVIAMGDRYLRIGDSTWRLQASYQTRDNGYSRLCPHSFRAESERKVVTVVREMVGGLGRGTST